MPACEVEQVSACKGSQDGHCPVCTACRGTEKRTKVANKPIDHAPTLQHQVHHLPHSAEQYLSYKSGGGFV